MRFKEKGMLCSTYHRTIFTPKEVEIDLVYIGETQHETTFEIS